MSDMRDALGRREAAPDRSTYGKLEVPQRSPDNPYGPDWKSHNQRTTEAAQQYWADIAAAKNKAAAEAEGRARKGLDGQPLPSEADHIRDPKKPNIQWREGAKYRADAQGNVTEVGRNATAVREVVPQGYVNVPGIGPVMEHAAEALGYDVAALKAATPRYAFDGDEPVEVASREAEAPKADTKAAPEAEADEVVIPETPETVATQDIIARANAVLTPEGVEAAVEAYVAHDDESLLPADLTDDHIATVHSGYTVAFDTMASRFGVNAAMIDNAVDEGLISEAEQRAMMIEFFKDPSIKTAQVIAKFARSKMGR